MYNNKTVIKTCNSNERWDLILILSLFWICMTMNFFSRVRRTYLLLLNDIVKCLHPDRTYRDIQNRMFKACTQGDIDIVKYLTPMMNVTQIDDLGWSPILHAFENGHIEIVQWLHAHGAVMDFVLPRFNGYSPIVHACIKGHLDIIKWLHAHDASMDVTRPINNGITLMFIACWEGHIEIVQWLHSHGAAMDVTQSCNDGRTPMYIACKNGYFEIVQWLHTHGAAMDVTRTCNNGATPMYIACQKGYLEIVQWLHANGAAKDVTRPCNDSSTPMMTTCEHGYIVIVKWLLTHGCDITDITRLNWKRWSPIGFACQEGHLNIVQHIIRQNRIPPNTLEDWHPRLSSSNKIQLRQAAHDNFFDCQSFLTLATIVCYINIEPYKKVNEETSRIVVPRSSILIFRHQIVKRRLLRMVASYLCGGEKTREIWRLISKR